MLPGEPAVRGIKRTHGPPCLAAGPDAEEVQEAERRQPIGCQVLSGVPGHYVKASESNAEAHSTALVLGRLYAACAVHNMPDSTC